jgi:hypothetical protein
MIFLNRFDMDHGRRYQPNSPSQKHRLTFEKRHFLGQLLVLFITVFPRNGRIRRLIPYGIPRVGTREFTTSRVGHAGNGTELLANDLLWTCCGTHRTDRHE